MNQTLITDTIITWDPCRRKEIEEAKKEFLKYRSLGHVLVKPDGSRMTSFEPSSGQFTILEKKPIESVLKILNDKGDERIVWTKENGRQAKNAKEQFEKLLAKHYKAFSVDDNGKKKKQITEFDVDAETIIMIPPTSRG